MPSIQSRRLKQLKELLNAVQVPMITYSTSTAQALFDAQQMTAFSTVPSIDSYVQVCNLVDALLMRSCDLFYDF